MKPPVWNFELFRKPGIGQVPIHCTAGATCLEMGFKIRKVNN